LRQSLHVSRPARRSPATRNRNRNVPAGNSRIRAVQTRDAMNLDMSQEAFIFIRDTMPIERRFGTARSKHISAMPVWIFKPCWRRRQTKIFGAGSACQQAPENLERCEATSLGGVCFRVPFLPPTLRFPCYVGGKKGRRGCPRISSAGTFGCFRLLRFPFVNEFRFKVLPDVCVSPAWERAGIDREVSGSDQS